MSLVGTRPILQDELLKYELHHRARIAIKPGITGMWQVSGRSDITDFEEVVRLDTEYISNCTGEIINESMVHNGHIEYPRIKKHLMQKHEAMNAYFEKMFTEMTAERIGALDIPKQDENYKDCIWICWWQGLENAPEIVKRCVASIQKHAGNHKIIMITDENYKEFISFPMWIEEKYKRGIITKTHLSDLLRISLLARYGGVWLDSTFFCTGDLEPCFKTPIWSIKRPDYRHVSVSCGEFANYSFGCTSEYRKVFAILREYLLDYWKQYDYMIDYLFLDYLIVLARKQNSCVDQAFAKIPSNNKNCDELLKVLGIGLTFKEKRKFMDMFAKSEIICSCWADYPVEKLPFQQRLFHQCMQRGHYRSALLLIAMRKTVKRIKEA